MLRSVEKTFATFSFYCCPFPSPVSVCVCEFALRTPKNVKLCVPFWASTTKQCIHTHTYWRSKKCSFRVAKSRKNSRVIDITLPACLLSRTFTLSLNSGRLSIYFYWIASQADKKVYDNALKWTNMINDLQRATCTICTKTVGWQTQTCVALCLLSHQCERTSSCAFHWHTS
jgi:hypothetical protein